FSSIAPWLPVSEDYENCNVMAQIDNPHSILSLYRRLIQLRKEHGVLQTGDYKAIETNETSCFAYMRFDNETCLLILLNFSTELLLPKVKIRQTSGDIVLSTLMDKDGEVIIDKVQLRPSEGLIIKVVV